MSTTRMSRFFAAPRSAVYRALTDASAVAAWRVPDGMTGHIHVYEPCVGGAFRISLSYDRPTGAGKTDLATDTYQAASSLWSRTSRSSRRWPSRPKIRRCRAG